MPQDRSVSPSRPVHPLDRWTEEERARLVAGHTLRRTRPRSVDPFIVSGLVLLGMVVVGIPVMAWVMGRYVIGVLWR